VPRTRTPLALIAAVVLSVGSVGAVVAADASPSAAPIPTDTAEGITWQLREYLVGGDALTPVPDGVVVTLLMEAGSAGGSGGCNSYSGSYTLDGTSLTFGPITSTMMACEEPAMGVETAYFANLAVTATWFSDGDSLTLQDAAGQTTLVFDPAPEAIPTDGFEGLTWQLVEYTVGGDAVAQVPDGVIVTLSAQGGAAGGSGGCNSYTADYTLDGSSITFGPITSTLMLCEGPGGEVETAYFATLPEVTGWFSDGGRLTFTDDAGSPLLVFEPAPAASIEGGWVATGINNGQGGLETTAITPEVTAVFAAGELSGSDGCNTYSTTYTLDGDRISIAPEIVTTRMACPSEEHSAQAAQYVAALVAATTWTMDPVRGLELRDDSGALQVTFTAAAA
jgi:heat shock protein HslJ